ncbi:translation initiation factor IF-2-like [Malurus melanocephalus]|uniref:translation initiation factor IF-2-like n=1 Tax=Malurus melanocephalus TaxID=175006 RepID=UPI0025467147|nr:translation initiation factor IF-2-like [Malurus melanocephalus]
MLSAAPGRLGGLRAALRAGAVGSSSAPGTGRERRERPLAGAAGGFKAPPPGGGGGHARRGRFPGPPAHTPERPGPERAGSKSGERGTGPRAAPAADYGGRFITRDGNRVRRERPGATGTLRHRTDRAEHARTHGHGTGTDRQGQPGTGGRTAGLSPAQALVQRDVRLRHGAMHGDTLRDTRTRKDTGWHRQHGGTAHSASAFCSTAAVRRPLGSLSTWEGLGKGCDGLSVRGADPGVGGRGVQPLVVEECWERVS